MSGVYIRGVEIPKYGHRISILSDGHAYYEDFANPYVDLGEVISVQDHGRLGDFDALAKALRDEALQHTIIGDLNRMTFGVGDALCRISCAPTVIPADKVFVREESE